KAVLATEILPDEAHPLEKAVYAAAAQPGGQKIAVVRKAAERAMERIAEGLKRKGLVVANGQARQALWLPLMIAAIVPIVGGIKIAIGLSRERPVGFLIGATVVSVVVALAGFARKPLRSRRGDAVLRRLQARNQNLKKLPRLI